jgi:hypothetical protein
MVWPEERRVREAEEQKAEEEALRSLVPERIQVLSSYGDKYLLSGLTREQVGVAGAALKAVMK